MSEWLSKGQSDVKNENRGWQCGAVGKAPTCGISIPYPISHIPAVPFPIQLSANMPGKAAEDSPSSWVPVTHVADPEVPGS